MTRNSHFSYVVIVGLLWLNKNEIIEDGSLYEISTF